jgi:hypothetical protein
MRAISTVLDVSVCLLLVSAAVGTLVLTTPLQDSETGAGETAELLASTTLSVEYDLRGERRQAHGTAGTLLARAAVANASTDGLALSPASDSFRDTVRRAVRQRLAAPNRTQVLARWRPYRGAALNGTVTVGQSPPPETDVHSATVTVPVSIPASHTPAMEATTGQRGYDAVAAAVAAAVADGLLPDDRVDASAFRESPTAVSSAHRYRAFAATTGADVGGPLATGAIGTAHDRVVDSLTATFARDMRERFQTPAATADTVRTGTVRLTVRRWGA